MLSPALTRRPVHRPRVVTLNVRRRTFKMPDPGPMIPIGTLLSLRVLGFDHRVRDHEFTIRERCFVGWSKTRKAIVVLPKLQPRYVDLKRTPPRPGMEGRDLHLDQPEVHRALRGQLNNDEKSVREAAKLYREYAARPATRYANETIDEPVLTVAGCGTEIIYRSNKWNGEDGHEVNYKHDFVKRGTDAVAFSQVPPGQPPTMWITGPRLTVTARGIIY